MKSSTSATEKSASRQIDSMFKDLGDWRGDLLLRLRKLIKEADPDVVEEIKWRKPSNPDGVPVCSHDGGICTGETYKDHVKLTFFIGASLEDPHHLFTQPGSLRRAIDFHEGDLINEAAFKNLIRSAVAFNVKKKKTKR
jgi:hypothetical protein